MSTDPLFPSGLIVSCQAEPPSPFDAPAFIVAFAVAAERGGAVGVRIAGIENVRAVRRAVRVPIIGLTKSRYGDESVLITAGEDESEELLAAGANLVATDATARPRPGDGRSGSDVVRALTARFGQRVVADVSSRAEGLAAAAAGAAFVGTTLSGYTPETRAAADAGPDIELVSALARELPGRVIAEGRIWTPEEAREALRRGAHAVVVGTAITRPIEIVRRFARAASEGLAGI